MVLNCLSDKFTFGQYSGCELGYILLYNPDYIVWIVENVRDGHCRFTDNAIEEICLMFPQFPVNQDFLTGIQEQRKYTGVVRGTFDDCNYCPRSETPSYDRYCGSYAQDVMGYSDDDIDTIFDGDPDAYWNID